MKEIEAIAVVLDRSTDDGRADEKDGESREVRMTVQVKPALRTASMPSWLSVK